MLPVPTASLRLLYDAACMDTGGSQAARCFLFWLAGQPDPTGFVGAGVWNCVGWTGRLKPPLLR